MEHVAADIVQIRSLHRARASDDDVVSGVHTIATGAVGAQEIIPAVAPNQVSGLAVNSDVPLLVTTDTFTGGRIQLDEANGAEIGPIGSPKPSCRGVKQQRRVNGIVVLHAV